MGAASAAGAPPVGRRLRGPRRRPARRRPLPRRGRGGPARVPRRLRVHRRPLRPERARRRVPHRRRLCPGRLLPRPRRLRHPGPSPSCSRPCCSSDDCGPDAHYVCAIMPSGGGSVCRPASEIGRARPAGPAAARSLRRGRRLPLRPLPRPPLPRHLLLGHPLRRRRGDASPARPTRPPRRRRARAASASLRPPRPPGSGAPCRRPLRRVTSSARRTARAPRASARTFAGVGSFCAPPCCTSHDCEDLAPGVPVRCVTVPGPQPVRACAAIAEAPGSEASASRASTDADCRGGTCLEQGGRGVCSDACCSDASCGDQRLPRVPPYQPRRRVGLAVRAQVTDDLRPSTSGHPMAAGPASACERAGRGPALGVRGDAARPAGCVAGGSVLVAGRRPRRRCA